VELLIIAVFVWAAKGGFDHLKADYRRSRDARISRVAKTHPKGILPKHKRASVARQHASGYWLREALHGFPVYRTGMHAGWIAHQTASTHAEAKRAEARTTQAETAASVRRTLREQVRRQKEAAAEAEEVWDDPEAVIPEGSPRERGRTVADLAEARRRKAAQEGSPADPPLPSDTVGEPEPGPYGRQPDDLAEGSLSGETPVPPSDLPLNDPRSPDYVEPPDELALWEDEPASPPSASNPTRGPTVADTTYDSAMARSAEVSTDAEGLNATIAARRQEIEQMADDMQASGVGAKTVSAAMDAVDLWGDAEKALTSAAEGEENFASALQAHYSELNEATQNAPDGAADPTFHEG
jgi:outer membrane murein-binding lipoprotein Lpp